MLTDEQLAELERLDREATPGPWAIQDLGGWWQVAVNGDEMLVFDDGTAGGEYSPSCGASDRDFIIATRNALPELVAEVRRLRDARAVLEGANDCLVRERDEARAQLHASQEAFNLLRQRLECGRRAAAFGMRERAARLAEQAIIGIDPHDGMERLVDAIRALQLPGDEP